MSAGIEGAWQPLHRVMLWPVNCDHVEAAAALRVLTARPGQPPLRRAHDALTFADRDAFRGGTETCAASHPDLDKDQRLPGETDQVNLPGLASELAREGATPPRLEKSFCE